MSDPFRTDNARSLMQEMGFDAANIEHRKGLVSLEPADLARIVSLRDLVNSHVEEYTNTFFDHLAKLEAGRGLLARADLREAARRLKINHLRAIVSGDYGLEYVEQRLQLALLYATAGLEPRAFLGAFQSLLHRIGADVMKQFAASPSQGFENFMSLEKIAYLDIGLIVDVLVFERERVIRQQQEAIRELSTPVLQLRDRLLLLPIVGAIDAPRARLITANLLASIRATRAKVVVIDVTGVAAIDSDVANRLLQTVAAVRLMGARVIVTGLSSEVARSLAVIGIEFAELSTLGDLQVGLEEAEKLLGYRRPEETGD